MFIAVTRDISPNFNQCELTHLERTPIDVDLARVQHHQYEDALRELGCEVHSLPAEADLPDAVFVEDVAIVLDEVAVITRPGAASRRPEVESIAQALIPYRELCRIEAPATLDGGDVLRIGQTLYVGQSGRSNRSAAEQLRQQLAPFGYAVKGVPVGGCLHLKSAVTQIAADALLINPLWIDRRNFPNLRYVEIDSTEPYAANALLIGDAAIYPSSYPKTRKRLEARGIPLKIVDASEAIKAEGAVTCCSLIFRV
jgi:dimethylargininase